MHSSHSLQASHGRLQAIFLDRDGTINRERADYVKSWQEYEWLPGALDALCELARLGVPILVVSNQSAVGRGILDVGALDAIHAQVRAEAAAAGGRLDEFFVCPHTPAAQCACRKPQPGLLLEAARRYGLDLSRCVFVGDAITDMQAAQAAGCGWLLLRTGRQGEKLFDLLAALGVEDAEAQVVDDLRSAAALLTARAAADPLLTENSVA
jgi:D-glycero-D-manno-heptose 1,7-bisphosphate phosphatase